MEKIKLTKEQWDKLNAAVSIAETALDLTILGESHPDWKIQVENAKLVLIKQMRMTDA